EGRSELEAAEILGLSVAALHHHDGRTHRDDLEDAAGDVAERDFVDRARHGAQVRRQRTRRGRLAGGVAVALLAGAFTALPRGPDEISLPEPAPLPSSSASQVQLWDPSATLVAGTRAQVGPTREQLAG